MTSKVRKAVFPVAGLGTRFLPATKASPKEVLPVVDKPLVQCSANEAVYACSFEHKWCDFRDKAGYLEATVETALKRPELGQSFARCLQILPVNRPKPAEPFDGRKVACGS